MTARDENDLLMSGQLSDDPEDGCKVISIAATAPAKRHGVRSIGEILSGVYERAKTTQNTRGMPSGIATIDAIIGGFRPGRVTVLGASTSWGKSSFALLTANSTVKIGGRVLLVSGEDSEDTYGQRLMSMRAGVNAIALRDGGKRLVQEDWRRMSEVLGSSEPDPFFLNGIGKTAEALAQAIIEISDSEKTDLVIVDYLQAFTCAKRCQDRRNEITHIARLFTDAIKKSGASGLLFSQLKRLDEGTIPTMHDLKESGDVENMAEHVLIGFGVKEDKSNVPQDHDARHFDTWKRYVLVAKNKDGPRPADPLALEFSTVTASFVPQGDIREPQALARVANRQRRSTNAKHWQDKES